MMRRPATNIRRPPTESGAYRASNNTSRSSNHRSLRSNGKESAKINTNLIITLVGVFCCVALWWTTYEHSYSENSLQELLKRSDDQPGGTRGLASDKKTADPEVSTPKVSDERVVHADGSSGTFSSNSAKTKGARISVNNTVEGLRKNYQHRFQDDQLYTKGVEVFGQTQIDATAHRILRAAAQKRDFRLSFAGYSVTVGRGNHYHQSYPFVLGRILEPLLQTSFGIGCSVLNSAIGGIPSFPYGFCFEHFLGPAPDVISWDFSMNEPARAGPGVLEAYVRQSQHQLQGNPMLIALDTNKGRCDLLRKYVSDGLLKDALCVGMAKDAVSDEARMLSDQMNDEEKPEGFRHWQEFGAPKRCPGRGAWHPKRMEHELIGWNIAMYFVDAVARAEEMVTKDPNWRTTFGTQLDSDHSKAQKFPPALSPLPANNDAVTRLLFGHPHDAGADDKNLLMHKVSCRTNFLPAQDNNKVLPSIVVSGLSVGTTAENIMDERPDSAYQAGWVLDVSHVERDTKIKVEKCGGLGYVDLKTALYGVPESGTLRLWLPAEVEHDNHSHDEDDMANHWFDEVIICEANEKRGEEACHLDRDVEYTVGGVTVTDPVMIKGAAEYLKRPTCVHVGVPTDARVTHLRDVTSVDGSPLSEEARTRLAGSTTKANGQLFGLAIDLKTKQNVSRKAGACCVSHVVWEQH